MYSNIDRWFCHFFNIQATTQFFEELKATVFMLIQLEMQLMRQSKVYLFTNPKTSAIYLKGFINYLPHKPIFLLKELAFFPRVFEYLGK